MASATPTVGTVGTLKIYGRFYRAEVVRVGRCRVTVRFRVAGLMGESRERTVRVTHDPVAHKLARRATFLPREVTRG